MTEVETAYVAWGEVSRALRFENPAFVSAMAAMEGFAEEKVLRVKVPYGTTIIEEGIFQWDLLDDFEDLGSAYCEAPIPMGLVTSKVMELNAPVPGQVHRRLPIYVVPEGKFFGLFETYAPARVQSKLWGTAGASTLLVLPLIGNNTTIVKFGNSIDCTFSDDLLDGIKSDRKSPLTFGRFFEVLLRGTRSDWRMEFVLFPRTFVDKLERHWPAYGALRQLTLEQLATAHSRVETTLEMLEFHDKATDADALAVRQVARGYRSGFVPVFGTADDERLLPATELHKLLYTPKTGLFTGMCEVAGDALQQRLDFYPAIFRPSLPWEDSYYFLKRPYGPDVETATKVRLANLKSAIDRIDRINRGNPLRRNEAKLYTSLSSTEFQAMVERQVRDADIEAIRPVCIGPSPFIKGGVIHVQRMQTKKA